MKFKLVQSCGGNGALGQISLFSKLPPSDAAIQVHVPWVPTSLECPRSSVGKSRSTQDWIIVCVLSWIFDIFVLPSPDFCEVEKYILWYSITSANIKHLEVDDTLPSPFFPLPPTQDMAWLDSVLQPLSSRLVWQSTETWLEIMSNCLGTVYTYQWTHAYFLVTVLVLIMVIIIIVTTPSICFTFKALLILATR